MTLTLNIPALKDDPLLISALLVGQFAATIALKEIFGLVVY